jgi:hypothetical protein
MQLSRFYKFQCDKCSERQIFSNFGILTQHCREKHQTKSFVSCCDQTLWERDELLDHMLDHKDSYRWDTLLLSCSRNSLFSVASSALTDSLALQNFLVYSIVKIICRIKIRIVCVGQCVCLYVCGSVYM